MALAWPRRPQSSARAGSARGVSSGDAVCERRTWSVCALRPRASRRTARPSAEALDVPRIELPQVAARPLGAEVLDRRGRSPSRARRGPPRPTARESRGAEQLARTATGCRASRVPAARRRRRSTRTPPAPARRCAGRPKRAPAPAAPPPARGRARSRGAACGAGTRGGDGSRSRRPPPSDRQPARDLDPAAGRPGAGRSGA